MRLARPLASLALLAVLAFVAVSWGHAGGSGRPANAQETVTITVGDFFFCDPSLPPGGCQTVINVGNTVVWDYRTGSEGHTVTHCGDSCDRPTASPLWDSGTLTPGQTFSHTFTAAGTYLYYCRFHPEAMRAVIVVKAPATATATQTAGALAASPNAQASASPTSSSGTGDEDGGGVSSWLLILAGVGGGIVLLSAGILALRRFR